MTIKEMTAIEKFAYFSYNCNWQEMAKVFGEHIGNHLWDKLNKDYKRDWGKWALVFR